MNLCILNKTEPANRSEVCLSNSRPSRPTMARGRPPFFVRHESSTHRLDSAEENECELDFGGDASSLRFIRTNHQVVMAPPPPRRYLLDGLCRRLAHTRDKTRVQLISLLAGLVLFVVCIACITLFQMHVHKFYRHFLDADLASATFTNGNNNSSSNATGNSSRSILTANLTAMNSSLSSNLSRFANMSKSAGEEVSGGLQRKGESTLIIK